MIKAIIFDLGGVLVSNRMQAIYADIEKTLDISTEVSFAAWEASILPFRTGKITEAQFWQAFLKHSGSVKSLPKESLFMREYTKTYTKHTDVLNLVQKLKNQGYTLALVSNTIKPHMDYNRAQGILDNFPIQVFSCEVGFAKPDPKIYQIALNKLEVAPHETVLIDDQLPYVEGAKKLGIHGIVYSNFAQLIKDLQTLGIKE